MEVFDESSQLKQLNEMFIKVYDSLDSDIENSVYYAKLRNLLYPEIYNFCKERVELKQDLDIFRLMVGQTLSEKEIKEYLDSLKAKYNLVDNDVALDYHIEATRIDFGVPVFVIIKRNQIYMKKFVFRFKKKSVSETIDGISAAGVPNKPIGAIYKKK